MRWERDLICDEPFDGADQANQMLNRLRALFLPGRAGAGAGLENLVQVAEFGSSRQL